MNRTVNVEFNPKIARTILSGAGFDTEGYSDDELFCQAMLLVSPYGIKYQMSDIERGTREVRRIMDCFRYAGLHTRYTDNTLLVNGSSTSISINTYNMSDVEVKIAVCRTINKFIKDMSFDDSYRYGKAVAKMFNEQYQWGVLSTLDSKIRDLSKQLDVAV